MVCLDLIKHVFPKICGVLYVFMFLLNPSYFFKKIQIKIQILYFFKIKNPLIKTQGFVFLWILDQFIKRSIHKVLITFLLILI